MNNEQNNNTINGSNVNQMSNLAVNNGQKLNFGVNNQVSNNNQFLTQNQIPQVSAMYTTNNIPQHQTSNVHQNQINNMTRQINNVPHNQVNNNEKLVNNEMSEKKFDNTLESNNTNVKNTHTSLV